MLYISWRASVLLDFRKRADWCYTLPLDVRRLSDLSFHFTRQRRGSGEPSSPACSFILKYQVRLHYVLNYQTRTSGNVYRTTVNSENSHLNAKGIPYVAISSSPRHHSVVPHHDISTEFLPFVITPWPSKAAAFAHFRTIIKTPIMPISAEISFSEYSAIDLVCGS